MPAEEHDGYVLIGNVGAAYGIKGWVKLNSYTSPADNILGYRQLYAGSSDDSDLRLIEVDDSRSQGKGFVGHIKGCDDRDATREFTGKNLYVEKGLLPELDEDEFYWHQLEGLRVINLRGEDLGIVDHLLATGANDVLVLRPDETSIDEEERLIPYLRDRVVRQVDLDQGLIQVDWDKDF